jgi:hypothetical protein
MVTRYRLLVLRMISVELNFNKETISQIVHADLRKVRLTQTHGWAGRKWRRNVS